MQPQLIVLILLCSFVPPPPPPPCSSDSISDWKPFTGLGCDVLSENVIMRLISKKAIVKYRDGIYCNFLWVIYFIEKLLAGVCRLFLQKRYIGNKNSGQSDWKEYYKWVWCSYNINKCKYIRGGDLLWKIKAAVFIQY